MRVAIRRLAVLSALVVPAQALAAPVPVPARPGAAIATVDYVPDNSKWSGGHQTVPYRGEIARPAPAVPGGYARGYADGYQNGYSSGYDSGSVTPSPQYAPSFNDKYGFTSRPR